MQDDRSDPYMSPPLKRAGDTKMSVAIPLLETMYKKICTCKTPQFDLQMNKVMQGNKNPQSYAINRKTSTIIKSLNT